MKHHQQESAEAVVLNPLEPTQATVIWLHGLGADGFDFVPVANELQLDALAVRFIFPHAASRPVTINRGFVMRAWYDIKDLSPGGAEDEEGVRQSAAVISELIARETASGVASDRIVLAGFSQGGAVALHTALRYPQRLAGVLALSTYLPLRASLSQEASAENRETPILMCHGEQDPMLPATLGAASRDFLQNLGYRVQWRSYPMEHTVSMEEIGDIAAWLRSVLA